MPIVRISLAGISTAIAVLMTVNINWLHSGPGREWEPSLLAQPA